MSTQTCLCAALAAIVASAAFVFLSHYQETEKPEILLGVCILSARENQELRAAIRNSWLTVAGNGCSTHDIKPSRTCVKFVIGSEACEVHPLDRVDPYGCQEWTPNISEDLGADFEAFVVDDEHRTGQSASILSIRVLHPVVIKRIGIRDTVALSEKPLIASVFKDFDEEEMVSVQFTDMDAGVKHRGYRYQPLEPMVLSKD